MAKNHSAVYAVFDVSSSSVAGAHVLAEGVAPDKKITLLASARSHAVLQEDIDIKRFVIETETHLDEVVSRIRKADVHHPSHIQVILASPWYRSQTRTIVYKKVTPFVCTQKLVDELIAKEIDHILANEEGSFGSFGKESIIIEKQLSLIKLNGYHTTKPYGKRAQTLELFLMITIAPKPILDRFTDTLRRAYGTRDIAYTTSPFTTFVVVRDTVPDLQEECVVIDIGEEVTDVAFIKDGFLLYQHSFPVGTYALYRALSTHGFHTTHEAKALLEAHRLGKLAPRESLVVETAITSFVAQWRSGLRSILDNGQYGFCIPETCFITADPRFETIFTTSIQTDPYIQHTCSRGVVNPHFINSETLAHRVGTTEHSTLDIPLATGSLFVERLLL